MLASQLVSDLEAPAQQALARWGKVVDHTTCIGCHACTTACKSENEVPLGVTRTYVKYVDVGAFPEARRVFQVTRCNQCEDSPCTVACPTSAMYRRPDGIVDFDKNACIGCKACIAACPYDAIFINPEDHSAEKCNFCAHRIDQGLEPACVVVCPTQSIMVGDLNDPGSRVSQIVHRDSVQVRRPEKATRPKLFYKGAHQATLDPLAARRPEGGIFMWSEQKSGDAHDVVSGHPGRSSSSAAAVLSYDVPHKAPWDWRVSLYTLTKGIASGVYLIGLLVTALTGEFDSTLWTLVTPALGLLFLALTGVVLISDLEHPKRFYYLFTRPQWRSWLVRGAVIIAVYGGVLTLHLALGWLGIVDATRWLAWLGVPAAVMTAVYTAYLFAQAKARDLWQSSILPPHLLVQACLAGSAVLLPFVGGLSFFLPGVGGAGTAVHVMAWLLTIFGSLHLLMILGEVTLTHVTAHAALALRAMTHGKYKNAFYIGILLMVPAVVAPWTGLGAWILATSVLGGLLAYEHAYVQAGQSVPLA